MLRRPRFFSRSPPPLSGPPGHLSDNGAVVSALRLSTHSVPHLLVDPSSSQPEFVRTILTGPKPTSLRPSTPSSFPPPSQSADLSPKVRRYPPQEEFRSAFPFSPVLKSTNLTFLLFLGRFHRATQLDFQVTAVLLPPPRFLGNSRVRSGDFRPR